ncbi:glutathione S-transferase family protein [uncultured Erythrobacter sp.]|uniref:glutathione S-transferase family protein n=1 Tax=uncultured Erythrobacter sp. TaxID=263913 RepID=UPI002639C3C6|nr:glutathione S-transferase family protein [uncultured Erythrobacter sp.]
MKVTLIGPSISPFVIKVKAALTFKGLDFEHREYVGISELRKLNPQTGKVPILLIDDEPIFDSSLILRRIEQAKPNPSFYSGETDTAAKQSLLEDWSDESLYWYVQALRWCEKNEPCTIAENKQFVPKLLRPFANTILRRLVGRQPLGQGFGRLPYELLVSELEARMEELGSVLGNKPHFYADKPSVADFAIYGVASTGHSGATPEFADAFAKHANLVDWRGRMRSICQ